MKLWAKALYAELLSTVTASVEFSFYDKMYKQTGGVAWALHLAQHLQYIFWILREETALSNQQTHTVFP